MSETAGGKPLKIGGTVVNSKELLRRVAEAQLAGRDPKDAVKEYTDEVKNVRAG